MTKYVQSEGIVMRKIGDAFFLIDIHQNYSMNNMFLNINSMGSYIWQQLACATTVEQIGERITAELSDQSFPEQKEILSDISSFIDMLIKSGYARVISNG